MNLRFLCCILLGLSLSSSVHARRIYVSSTSEASDDHSGTFAKPMRHIGSAIQAALPGDWVVIRGGDYRDEDTGYGVGVIPVLVSGTVEAPIQIRPYRDESVVVNRLLIQDQQHIQLTGLHFQGTDFAQVLGWRDMPHIVRDERDADRPDFTLPWNLRQSQIEREFRTYFSLIENLPEVGIDLVNSHNVRISQNSIDGFWAGIQTRRCTEILIQANSITHTVNGIFTWRPFPALKRSTISGNQISQSLDNGIDLREATNNVLVVGNQIEFSGRSHISLQNGSRNISVINNQCCFGGYYSETMEFPGSSGISVNDCAEGNQVKANFVAYQVDKTRIDGNGIIIDFIRDEERVVVNNNTCWRNEGDGINTTASPNTYIRGNLLMENGFGIGGNKRGAGLRLSRDLDINQVVLDNTFAFNRSAGIKASGTIFQQAMIDRNTYIGDQTPLIWDSEVRNLDIYRSLSSVRQRLGWEASGIELVLPLDESPINPQK